MGKAKSAYLKLKVREFLTFAIELEEDELSKVIAQLELIKGDKKSKNYHGDKIEETTG